MATYIMAVTGSMWPLRGVHPAFFSAKIGLHGMAINTGGLYVKV